jgi:hypothetical protein
MDQIEKPRDDLHLLIERQRLLDDPFRRLIESDDEKKNDEQDPVFFLHQEFPERKGQNALRFFFAFPALCVVRFALCGDRLDTPTAEGWVFGMAAHTQVVVPAPLTFLSGG